ncbi:MAG: OmpW family outer membrane protein [Thiolinea sp.]
MKKLVMACMVAMIGAGSQAFAYEPGDIVLRVGAAQVDPAGDGLDTALGHIDVDSNTQLGLSTSYMVTDKLGVAVLAATPFKHDITLDGETIGDTKHLPPTVTLQYHIDTGSAFRPYLGAGFNYTHFFSEDSVAGKLDLDHSFGLAAEAGFDYALNDRWALNAAVYYADIDTTAKLDGAKLGDVEIDPWVYMLGASYRF